MSRGVQRIIVNRTGNRVKLRAQSKTARGTHYSVGALEGDLPDEKGPGRHAALVALLDELYAATGKQK